MSVFPVLREAPSLELANWRTSLKSVPLGYHDADRWAVAGCTYNQGSANKNFLTNFCSPQTPFEPWKPREARSYYFKRVKLSYSYMPI